MKKTLFPIISVLAIILMLGIAGNHDRAEQVIYNLNYDLYQLIRSEIGDDPSDIQIADYYLAHQHRLDSISASNGW